ncbi:uncharacterized protein LOC121837101 [Ixodes scapularis]|uniref:uncharacterized protein LOC115314131 n=2 Tax=Ixodes scapularis TaxID=6945 RepID=UPI00116160FF|nr:uncharacterized protein LOC115314131 [Ixodes scapularis]XP_040074236.1 uncharacterized protein LOC120846515 [Ixodes scapularis]XP_042148491.1 uncharacterized protein LOC121837101 [Ixodes scapularis]
MEGTSARATIFDSQMCVQVQGEDLSPEEFHSGTGWTQVGERMSRLRQRDLVAKLAGTDNQVSKNAKGNKNVRASAIKAARMPAMPLEENKIVIRPRGGLDITKIGTTTVATAILAAAKITTEENASDTICPNALQNIMVVSTPKEENAVRYARIQTISIQDKTFEVSAYRTAPHDTVKGIIRGIPVNASAEELDSNIVNDRNPLAVGAKRIGNTTTIIVAFGGPKVPNFVRYGVTLIPCNLYRKQIDVCHQCGRVGHRKDVCPTPTNRICRGCGQTNPKEDHKCTPKCKLCGGAHLTADRECKAKYKVPYVVRKRQWERRKQNVSDWLPSESNFPLLDEPAARKSRTPSRNRAPSRNSSSRSQSRDARQTKSQRSKSRERVSWADAARGIKKTNSNDNAKKEDKASTKEREINEALKQENASLRATINNLTKEIAEIRNVLCTIEQPRSCPSDNNKVEEATTDGDKAPAPKKRAFELRKTTKNVSSCSSGSSSSGSSNNNVEAKLSSLEDMIKSMKEAIQAFQTENVNRLNNLERSLQLTLSNPTFGPLQQQVNQAQQPGELRIGPSWPPAPQA